MDPLVLCAFLLGIAVVLYTTVYTYLEYRWEQRMRYDELLKEVSHNEVFMFYAWPLMIHKLGEWEERRLVAMEVDAADPLTVFTDIRRSLMFTPIEYAEYKRQCKETMERRRTWMSAPTTEVKIEEACAVYVWHKLPLDQLVAYLERVTVHM